MPLELTPLPTNTPNRIELDAVPFAKHDPILCLLPGMFRVVDEKSRKDINIPLTLAATHGPLTVELSNPYLLNGNDLSVLQAIVALATSGNTLDPARPELLTSHEQVLIDNLLAPDRSHGQQQPIREKVLHLQFSVSALLELIGWSACGENRTLVQDCLQRLATCVLSIFPTDEPQKIQCFRLISVLSIRGESARWNRTHVALNPRLSEIISDETSRHTRIGLNETRKLGKNQAARILHQRLCAWINEGTTRPVTYETLVGYLYPTDAEGGALSAQLAAADPRLAKQSAEKTKVLQLREMQSAMNVLATLPGWSVHLASDAPFVPDPIMTDYEQGRAEQKHNKSCSAARRAAAIDVMKTVIHVRRGRCSY